MWRGSGMNFEAIRRLAEGLPGVEAGTTYGAPALKLGKRLVLCVPSHKSAEPDSVVVRTSFEEREALLSEDPGTYYLTDHYVNHPVVLVWLSRIGKDQL